MKTKKFYTVAEIASILNNIELIDMSIADVKINFDSELSKKLIAYYEKKRKEMVWVFDLNVDDLVMANKYRKGDTTINGNKKIYK